MDILYGAEVTDKNGKVLGKVNHVMRDTWTGDIRKFIVREEAQKTELILSPEDVHDETESKITLKVTLDDLNNRIIK